MAASLDIEITAGPIRAVSVTVAFADTPIIQGPCFLFGWSLRETTGANPAQYEIKTGTGVIAEVVIAGASSDTKWLGASGIYAPGGITIHPVGGETGSIIGALYIGYLRP